MPTYRSQIKHGVRYRDKATGFEGSCTGIFFYEHGCERAQLKGINANGEVVYYDFDAPEMEEATTKRPVTAKVPGGPHGRSPGARR